MTENSSETAYDYDVLDNLIKVTQPSAGTRQFTYSCLSRLISATNPESGTTTFTYYDDGNLWTRTDARSLVTTYTYDDLGRISTKTFSDSAALNPTPSVSYTYDSATVGNSKGRLTSVVAGTTEQKITQYDDVGRVKASAQVTNSVTYTFPSYSYNRLDALTSVTYPSGRVISTAYNTANRPSSLTGVLSGTGVTYGSGFQYSAAGASIQTVLGATGVTSYAEQDSRLRISAAGLKRDENTMYGLTLGFESNGNVSSQSIAVAGVVRNQSYTYDTANRIKTAEEIGNWLQTYVYDARGNRAVLGGSNVVTSALTPQTNDTTVPYDSSNRLPATAAAYDLAGNIIALPGMALSWDAESRLYQTQDSSSGNKYRNYYDGEGRRTVRERTVGGVTASTVYVYDAMGQLAAEYGSAASGTGTAFLFTDWLGSRRATVDASGNVVTCHDYLPFGEEIPVTWGTRTGCYAASDADALRFTGKSVMTAIPGK